MTSRQFHVYLILSVMLNQIHESTEQTIEGCLFEMIKNTTFSVNTTAFSTRNIMECGSRCISVFGKGVCQSVNFNRTSGSCLISDDYIEDPRLIVDFHAVTVRVVKKDCGTPNIPNSAFGAMNTLQGSSVTVTCMSGYSATISVIVCQTTGVWTATECQRDCGTPNIPNSAFGAVNTLQGSSVTVTCMSGYSATINVIVCQTTGVWTATECQRECSPLPSVHGGTFLTPDGVTEGAVGTVQCDNVQDLVYVTSATCQASGNWDETTLVCWARVMQEFDTQNKRIFNPTTGTNWHNDASGDQRVSVRYQPTDSYIDFDLSFQSDFSYKFWDYNAFMCDGYGTSMTSLHSDAASCPDEDHTHFYIYTDATASTYRIVSKATNRVVRIGSDNLVTTVNNLADERAIFQIVD